MGTRKSGQRIIVTGAGRGIGRAIAKEMARAGHAVALMARTQEQIERVGIEIAEDPAVVASGGRAIAIAADVTDRRQVEEAAAQVESAFGGLDALVNNAGRFATIGPTWETDPESFWGDITANLLGPYLLCRAAIPRLIASGGKGAIVNLIGGGSGSAIPYGNAYGTSKAGLTRFSETLAEELKPHGVAVYALNPGLVRTEMTEYQLTTEAGKKWMARIQKAFDDGVDVPPEYAAGIVRGLVEGDFFKLTGRRFGPKDDLEALLADAERIVAEDLRALRFTS